MESVEPLDPLVPDRSDEVSPPVVDDEPLSVVDVVPASALVAWAVAIVSAPVADAAAMTSPAVAIRARVRSE